MIHREPVDRSCLMHELSQEISLALTDLGYADLTEVQQAVIPAVLAGQDLIVSAPTGSGKTAAFAIPVLRAGYADTAAAAGPGY